jgi:hypothetical protein
VRRQGGREAGRQGRKVAVRISFVIYVSPSTSDTVFFSRPRELEVV